MTRKRTLPARHPACDATPWPGLVGAPFVLLLNLLVCTPEDNVKTDGPIPPDMGSDDEEGTGCRKDRRAYGYRPTGAFVRRQAAQEVGWSAKEEDQRRLPNSTQSAIRVGRLGAVKRMPGAGLRLCLMSGGS
jgi:hypothetical protein